MKFSTQIFLAIVAIVAVVAGVTFVSQYQIGGREVIEPVGRRGDQPSDPSLEKVLHFPMTVVAWEYPWEGDFEVNTKGSHDFWFENRNDVAVKLGLKSKSCKCSDVQICLLQPHEAKRYQPWALGAALSQIGSAQRGLLALLCQLNVENEGTAGLAGLKLDWQLLQVNEDKGITVPAQAAGVVRINWKEEKDKVGKQTIKADLWTQAQELGELGTSPRAQVMLEIPVRFVPAVQITTATLDVGNLNPHDENSAELACWSATRAGFGLKAQEKDGDRRFTCSYTLLTEAERMILAKKVQQRVLFGYRVRVSVRERLSDTEPMDLGPFVRRIVLTSDPDIPGGGVLVNGVVGGEITVEKVQLGTYNIRDGSSKTVRLIAERPVSELKYVRMEPENLTYLKVKPKPVKPDADGGATEWDLKVEAPPGSRAGKLPDHSAIVLELKIRGNPARLIRIPVTGMAYQN